ncbi:hypothetical protein [Streptomyces sp. NPDC057460]|uniref:hypothetical protein n=1 Tax=Streptomyces sp. NPDC057460 TaxID=3346141 RepID=UPI003678B22E
MVGEIRPFAGDAASKVPFVGGQLKKPLRSAAEAGTGLADAGRSLQDTVGHVAMLTTVALIVIPVVFVLLLWLPRACAGSAAALSPGASRPVRAAPTSSRCVSSPARSANSQRCPRHPAASQRLGGAATNTCVVARLLLAHPAADGSGIAAALGGASPSTASTCKKAALDLLAQGYPDTDPDLTAAPAAATEVSISGRTGITV